jgi:spore coat polysaccharide biosynthesis predicted glycosyltransferase SpsG
VSQRTTGGTVVVWCDLGPDIGVGHLMRCLALAEELHARGREVRFLVDAAAVPFAAAQLDARGFLALPPAPTVEGQLRQIADLAPEAVVIDSYRLPPSAYDAARASYRTLALVDGDLGGRVADVLLDQNIGAEDDERAVPDGAVRLAGLRYALMRDEVLRHRPEVPEVDPPAGAPRVFAFFGGTDAHGAAPVLTAALVATARPFQLSVVAATDESRAALAAIRPGEGQQVEVIAPTDRLAEQVRAADLVVSAAGTSSWELLCLGAAVAFVCVADNQLASYERVVAGGLAFPLGLLDVVREDPGTATATLAAALDDAGARDRLRRKGWELVDGRGRGRVVESLLDTGEPVSG